MLWFKIQKKTLLEIPKVLFKTLINNKRNINNLELI